MLDFQKLKETEGFTILEIIVVLAVITIGLIGVLSLMVQNVQIEYTDKNTMIASELAQEGLELVRNQRDTNWLAGSSVNWYAGFADSTGISYYKVDNFGITPVSAISETVLNFDTTNGYNHQTGLSTIFSRMLTVTRNDTSSSTLSVDVQWTDKGNVHNYLANTVLYDWK